jgi:plastocyanin
VKGALIAAAIAFGTLGGCQRAAPAHPAATYTVVIDKLAYGPAPIGLMVGDTITWKNADIFRHTATAKNGAFDIDLQPGQSGRVTLKSPGVIDVYCRYHPDMTMRLTVNSR